MRHGLLKYTVALVVFTVCFLFCGCDREETESSTYSGNAENSVSVYEGTNGSETFKENPASALMGGSGDSEKTEETESFSEKTEVTIEPEITDENNSDFSGSGSTAQSSEILSGEREEDDLVTSSYDTSGINPWDTDGDGYYDFKIP